MFLERLKELREEKGYSQKYVAESIKVAQSTYTLYEGGKREPGFETLCELSRFFNVSTDYLLGLDDIRNKESLNSLNSEYRDFSNVIVSFKEAEEFIKQLTNTLLGLRELVEDEGRDVSDPFFHIINNISLSVRLLGILKAEIEKKDILSAHFDFFHNMEYLRKSTIFFVKSLWGYFFHEAKLISSVEANTVELMIIDTITSMGVNNFDLDKSIEDLKNTPLFHKMFLKGSNDSAEEKNNAQCPRCGYDTPKG